MKQRLLDILRRAKGPMVAADLAVKLGLVGSRESQRRRVRALIKELRDDNNWIVATIFNGYWLTDDFGLWQDYLEGRKIDAKRIFAEVGHKKEQIKTAHQGSLFQ